MLKKNDIVGSEKPIFFEREDEHFTYDELVIMEENLNDYEHVGYEPSYIGKEQFFEKLYARRTA
ncbi:hypothetical protein [Terribacillus saccharophilus]|uniref:hypothetical protein n=1 Tax=Terribacillus saccharophilus TaxID=361277 RepID=UPI002989DE0F|nr:hypothetical protein [Terribacillus saccharophilus]MCM3227574.1 hypothetical protein [Terribacillus saccharophilus]